MTSLLSLSPISAMVSDTPYKSPDSQVINKEDLVTQKVRIFSLTQRIGRLRYLAYLLVSYLVLPFMGGMLSSLLVGVLSISGLMSPTTFGPTLMLIVYSPVVIATFIFTVRRLHDLDRSGWQSILLFIPIINLIIIIALMLVAGEQQTNRFGPPPGKNTAFTWLGALIPFILLLAAFGFGYWAYQDIQQQSETHSTSD